MQQEISKFNERERVCMEIQKMFDIGVIMEPEDKAASQIDLSSDDCVIVSKGLNKNKVILHLRREKDGIEGNVFVRLKEKYENEFVISRKLLGSKTVNGLTLNEFKGFAIENL